MKNFKVSIMAITLLAILLTSLPAWAGSVLIGDLPKVISDNETKFRLEIPSNAYTNSFNAEVVATASNKILPVDEFYVTRCVDISMKDRNPGIIHLVKPSRLVFSFDDIDFKRASQLKTHLSVGHFRIGRWDDTKKNWSQLPSLIFWNGSNGVVEAETQEPGRYALLWSYEENPQLSPIAEAGIRIMVNYMTIKPDAAPYIRNGRTMIPLRAVADIMNVRVEWNDAEKRVDLTSSDGTKVRLWVGKTEALKNDKVLNLEAAPEISEGRTFVPLRFVAEALGLVVNWDNLTSTAVLTKS